jgi:ABC-type polysaccharide/polyol phosphate transport system ATPase subunit
LGLISEMKSDTHISQPLIEVRDLLLRVPIFNPEERRILNNPSRFLMDLYLARTRRSIVTILDGISFTLQPSQRLGLIGANGAGKSTLLRVLAGIYPPTDGELIINGVAKGMFDISLGMNPEATGLENIYMRGLQMGMKLMQIKALVPQIVSFAELEGAIENPFNTYSNGMKMRLAFSISTLIKPDILLLDEWIGAADAHFNEKIQKRMNRLVKKSRGLVLATHNVELMKSLCTQGLVLDKGKMLFCGDLQEALDIYNNLHF